MVVEDLHKSFGKAASRKDVLRGLSLTIPAGSILALLGANGAGKTTLVNILSTLMLPSTGSASVDGHDVVRDARTVRELISLTGQFAAVDAELTGRENLIYFARLRGLTSTAARSRADELLAQFRLTEAARQLVASYSGGMRRRLDIAASLIVTPRLLFLDEPTTGLDPLSRRELWEMVEELRDAGVAILLTTQYLDEAERLADTIVLLRGGRSVLEGSPVQIRTQFGTQVCRLELDSPAEAARARTDVLPAALGIAPGSFTIEGLGASFPAARGADDLTAALDALREAGITVNSAQLSAPSLDDIFLELAFENADTATPGTADAP
ncbi:ABC transporter, ATP-binding protein [Gulosibacter sp. 10]|nr:ABC transporter, ATP-binding protein [Gulosibacter sp. 10]